MNLTKTITAAAMLAAAGVAQAAPATSAFTYQGTLLDDGVPASGVYDLRFDLWTQAAGGAQVGATITLNDVTVERGTFTVELDFGFSAFDGDARYVEVDVKPGVGGSFTTLTPRQPATAAPYAVRSLTQVWEPTGSGGTAGDGGDRMLINRTGAVSGAEYFGFTSPAGAAQYGGMYNNTSDAAGLPFYGYATGGVGRCWTYYDPGTGQWRVYNGGSRLVVNGTGEVGVGTTDPQTRLHVQEGAGVLTGFGPSSSIWVNSDEIALSATGAGTYAVNAYVNGASSSGALLAEVGPIAPDTATAGRFYNDNSLYDAFIGTPEHAGNFYGPVRASGQVSRSIGGSDSPVGPIAYGSIASSGSIYSATGNVSCTWNAASSRYEITLSDYSAGVVGSPATVTVWDQSSPRVATVDSSGSTLYVTVWNLTTNTKIQDNFSFAIFRPDGASPAPAARDAGFRADAAVDAGGRDPYPSTRSPLSPRELGERSPNQGR